MFLPQICFLFAISLAVTASDETTATITISTSTSTISTAIPTETTITIPTTTVTLPSTTVTIPTTTVTLPSTTVTIPTTTVTLPSTTVTIPTTTVTLPSTTVTIPTTTVTLPSTTVTIPTTTVTLPSTTVTIPTTPTTTTESTSTTSTTSSYEETTSHKTTIGKTVSTTTGRSYKDCGKPGIPPNIQRFPFTNLVVNGKEAKPHSWPWQVRMQARDHVDLNLWVDRCGGSIITPYDIVTAAHCFGPDRNKTFPYGWFENSSNWRILIGAHNISQFSTDYTIAYVADIDIHKTYHLGPFTSDIAIVTLWNQTEFSINVSPICLTKTDFPPNSLCYATGWGLNEKNVTPEVLLQADVRILRSDICRHYYHDLDETMVCAGNRALGPDTCQGDSGGPLVCQNTNGIWELQGITSFGNGCGIHPGVYTRVPHFVDWINERTINVNRRRYRG